MKRILTLMLALALCIALALPAAAAETGKGGASLADWEYRLEKDEGAVILTKYVGTEKNVTVPAAFRLGGRTYDTVLYSNTAFRANTNITSVTLEDVGFYENSMRTLFAECTALTAVDLSAVDTSDVTNMSYVFYGCTALKTLDLSALDTGRVTTMRGMFSNCNRLSGLTGYENWDTGSLVEMYQTFNRVGYSVSAGTPFTIDLSRWDLDQVQNTGWCFQTCRAQSILLPDNLAVMSAGFLNHAIRYAGTTFTVPAGVRKIGYAHTIYDFATNDFVEFRVAEGNTCYQAIDGILYSADGTEMLAVPRSKPFENGVYEIPEGVTFLGELSFSRNYNIHTLVLPDSYVLRYVPVYDPEYIVYEDTGNLNAGTNLSIAIYCYTGITHYAVKDSNPRYASQNGVIYSGDMTHVVAVPARYNEPLNIPEGVTHWDYAAMWADGSTTVDNLMANCAGVTIPASLTVISDDQREMLNRIHLSRKDGDNPFTISLAEGNTAFCLDDDGCLRAAQVIITEQPRDWAGLMGEYPNISVKAQGEDLTYRWYYRDADSTVFKPSSDTDDTYDAYPLSPMRDGREVYCVVTDGEGNFVTSESAFMRLDLPEDSTPLEILAQPQDWSGAEGEYPDISVLAQGDGLTYQWYCRDVGGSVFYASSEKDDTYDAYPMAPSRDGREVYCVVTDCYGRSVRSGSAFMRMTPPAQTTTLKITAQPQDWTGYAGEYPHISVAAQGDGLRYQWYYRDAGKTRFSASSERDSTYDSYPISEERNGRELYCVVTDRYGNTAASAHAFMYLAAQEDHPGFAVTAQPQDWYGYLGDYPDISVAAVGEGLTYRWYYRDAGAAAFQLSSDADDTYDSYPLTPDRAGREVYCVISDANGHRLTSETAVMDFAALPAGYSGPTITAQPKTWTGAAGEYVNIFVTAQGEGLTYQWYYRDAGTKDFRKSNETDAAYDSYRMEDMRDGREVYCVVTDRYGRSVKSDRAFMYAETT